MLLSSGYKTILFFNGIVLYPEEGSIAETSVLNILQRLFYNILNSHSYLMRKNGKKILTQKAEKLKSTKYRNK